MDRRVAPGRSVRPIVPQGSRLRKGLLATSGVILLVFTLPGAMVGWTLLPEGRWPVVLAAAPAIPFLWLGVVCLRLAGFQVDDFISRRPALFGLIVGLGAVVALLFAVALGFI